MTKAKVKLMKVLPKVLIIIFKKSFDFITSINPLNVKQGEGNITSLPIIILANCHKIKSITEDKNINFLFL